MASSKEIKVRYRLKGEPVESVYQFDGFDFLNSTLAHLVSLHIEPNLIPAQERIENGGKRNTQRNVNLIELGIDDVLYFDEESQKWIEIPSEWLVNA